MSKKEPSGNDLSIMISDAIKKTGIKEATIAERMKVSRQVINRIGDRKKFDLEFLQKLKDATGLDFTNYVFNPKRKKYEPINEVLSLHEPQSVYKKDTVEMSLTVKVKAEEDRLTQLSEMILFFKKEAINRGFQIA